MTLAKMPLSPGNFVMAGLVILAVVADGGADHAAGGPLSRRTFLRTSQPVVGVIWMHFFWIFGTPSLRTCPASLACSQKYPGCSHANRFRYSVMAGPRPMGSLAECMAHICSRRHGQTRILFRTLHMAIAVPTGIKIFNWLATMWGKD